MSKIRFHTRNSIYEVDQEEKKIRRIEGEKPSTEYFEKDGKWHYYEDLYSTVALGFGWTPPVLSEEDKSEDLEENKNAVVVFSVEDGNVTVTSPIQKIERVEE